MTAQYSSSSRLPEGFEFTVEFVENMPHEKLPGVLYVSDKFQATTHICPCGCGVMAYLPYGENHRRLDADHTWDFTNTDGKITIAPSILNSGCKAHYFIRGNRLVWA